MDESGKPRPTAPFELPETLRQFKKDHWKFGVVVIYAIVFLATVFMLTLH